MQYKKLVDDPERFCENFDIKNHQKSTVNILAFIMNSTEYGVFGTNILATYCGTQITSQFFDSTNNSYGMLLTEEEMGKIAIQNVAEFMAFTLLSVSVQVVFALYFKAIKYRCDSYTLSEMDNDLTSTDQYSEAPKCCESYAKSTLAKVLRFIALIWTVSLSGFVLAHCAMELKTYYNFVNQTLDYEFVNEILSSNSSYVTQVDIQRDTIECEALGIGRIACPTLFYQWDEQEGGYDSLGTYTEPYIEYTKGYTLQNAENICSWIFYMLIPSNPNVFQYSLLASFMVADTLLYIAVLFITSLLPGVLCNCAACFTCWCGCIEEAACCSFCCPAAKSCCSIGWCDCVCLDCSGDACIACNIKDGACCYCCCGTIGPILWITNIFIGVILMIVMLFGLGISLIVIGSIFLLVFLIISYILACPVCICHSTVYCCAVFNMFMGKGTQNFVIKTEQSSENGEEIELTVRPIEIRGSITDGESIPVKKIVKDKMEDINLKWAILYCIFCFPCATFSCAKESRKILLQQNAGSSKSALRLLCCGGFTKSEVTDIIKDPSKLKKFSMIISIINPLLMVALVALVQSFVSSFIIYYVVDGELFMCWQYFEPIFIGLWEYIVLFVEVMTDKEQLKMYLMYISTLSISWSSLINFAMKFESFKFSILFLRTLLHIFIGITDVISNSTS
eukprot:28268_1